MIKKAIIPAAGYGTRSLPITKVLPKEMFPIGGKPAIHLVVEEAQAAGIEEILIIVSRSKNIIIDYFDRSLELELFLKQSNKAHLLKKIELPKVNIHYVRQEYAKGLGDAISLGETFVDDEPFAVLLPDDIYIDKHYGISELINVYNEKNSNVLAINEVPEEYLKNYGVIQGKQLSESLYSIESIIEKPLKNPPSNFAVTGRYIFKPSVFSFLKQVKPGEGNEIQLTDAILLMLEHDYFYAKVCEGERYDIGRYEDYIKLVCKYTSY